MAHVEKVKTEKQPVLVVDSGDLFFPNPPNLDGETARKKARLVGQAYRRMGAGAVNVGCLDLLQGVDFLRHEYSQGLPLISANLLDPSTKAPIFQPYLIKEAAGLRVAFFGLLPPESGPEINLAIRRANEGKILIGDPVEAAREIILKLQGQADLVILLSDLGLNKDQLVAKAVPGIHFILGGHEGRFVRQAFRNDRTFILQSSAKGMNAGHLRLTLKNAVLPFRDEGEAVRLQERISRIDAHLRTLQATRESQTGQEATNLDRTIQGVTRQKNALEEELKRTQEAGQRGNRFQFTLEPMDMNLPEDEEVKKWIVGSGIEKE